MSWIVNILLSVAKVYVAIKSESWAILAVMVDSLVDLCVQGMLTAGETTINRHSPNYPIGRSRLETLAVIGCCFAMEMAAFEIIQYAAFAFYDGLSGKLPIVHVDFSLCLIMGLGILLKFVLWVLCLRLNAALQAQPSETIEALGEDHFTDVLTNSAAVLAVVVAAHSSAWWADSVGAVLIALLIAGRWLWLINQQVKKLVGYTAPPEFIKQLEALAHAHDPRLQVDCIRAYHFGAKCK